MKRLTLLAVAVLMPLWVQAAEPRVALVIGNSAYPSGPLRNPANDADLVAETLEKVGFYVIKRRNADQITMKRAIQEFGKRLEDAGPQAVGLFYYAGHGVQLSGRNYLIPTTANIEREGDVEIEAVSADWAIEQMRYARNALNIVILDACRNNPYTRGMRSADRGLAVMDVQAVTGLLIAYSTAPGTVAQDGDGRNSPYTMALTKAMLEEHEPLMELFQDVGAAVMKATEQKQVPWQESSLTGRFYFTAPENAAPTVARAATSAAPELSKSQADTSSNSGWLSQLSGWFVGLFSSNMHATTATTSVPAVNAPGYVTSGSGTSGASGNRPAISAAATISGANVLALFNTLGIQTQDIDAAQRYTPSAVRQLLESSPRSVSLGSTHDELRAALELCRQYSAHCEPSWYDDESLRRATLEPFELDRQPVSVAAFRQFTDSSHYQTYAEQVGHGYALMPDGVHIEEVDGGNWRNGMKRHAVDDDSPVVGVTFRDAAAYCKANGSRLPSEDEWEYIARGPSRKIFAWGNDPAPMARSMSVAPHVTDGPGEGIGERYRGLSGDVWQWVNTSAPPKTCACKVLKGGSWLESNPANKRAATRRYGAPDRPDEDSGFRCARSVSAWPDADLWMAQIH
jgi:formylglycine-generating enzyme required for sulfatase activity